MKKNLVDKIFCDRAAKNFAQRGSFVNSSLIGWRIFLQSGGGVVLFLHVGLELVRSLSLVQSKKNCQIKFLKQIGRQLELDKFSLAQFFLAVSDSPKFLQQKFSHNGHFFIFSCEDFIH